MQPSTPIPPAPPHPFGAIAELVLTPEPSDALGSFSRTGTAWLWSDSYALTAFHCIGIRTSGQLLPGRVQLVFRRWPTAIPIGVTVFWSEPNLDVALLALPSDIVPPGVRPPQLGQLEEQPYPGPDAKGWYSYGFPRANTEGLILSGKVTSTRATVNGRPALQLDCDQGGHGNLSGASGAAVFCDGAAVGILQESAILLDQRILYATPMELVQEALASAGLANLTPKREPLRHPLHAFPRKIAEFDWILPSIPEVFAQYCFDATNVAPIMELIGRANRFRQEADPGDRDARGLPLWELPLPAFAPPKYYWFQVFHRACKQDGRRMVAALLLMIPDFVFSGQARTERDWLLTQLQGP
jgi:hypothetical protein